MRGLWLSIGLMCLLAVGASACGVQAQPTPGAAPVNSTPVEIAHYVKQLAGAGRLEEARRWYFRGLIRAGVEQSLGQQYMIEGYTNLIGSDALSAQLMHADIDALTADLDAAILWEASAPLLEPSNISGEIRGRLPEIRQSVAAYFRGSIEEERHRRTAIEAVDAQIIRHSVTDESRSIAAQNNAFNPLNSVRIDCECELKFVGAIDGVPGIGNDGATAAVETCHDIIILNAKTGQVLQRVPLSQLDLNTATTLSDGDDIRIIALGNGRGRNGFLQITARLGIQPLALELPGHLDGRPVTQAARSSDGRMIALEFCADGTECHAFAAYDLSATKMVWTSPELTGGRHRLVSAIELNRGQYFLVSDIRSENPAEDSTASERVNLSTGVAQLAPYSEELFEQRNPIRPTCGLVEQGRSAVGERRFAYAVIWPGRTRKVVLTEPARAPIQSCTTSLDGRYLAVTVPPFVHRFEIRN